MKFDIKQKTAEVLNTFRVQIKMGHGDADIIQELNFGLYKEDEFYIVAGIVKAIKEMQESDKKTNNQHQYDSCPNFRRFLKEHWKYDIFTRNDSWRYYAYVSEYAVFYIDENGVEHEIENIESHVEPKNHYYIKIESGRRFFTFFTEWDVITTSEPLTESTIKQWRLVEISDGEAFLKKHPFSEVDIDREELEEDREFAITAHFEPNFETIEEETEFFNAFEELKNNAIFHVE